MQHFWIKNLFLSILLALSAIAHAERMVVAKRPKVKIFSSNSKKSAVVATIKKGQTLVSKERKGMFWSVQYGKGKKGYVSVLSVKPKKGGGGGLANALRTAVQASRSDDDGANVRSRSAVMGVRGLDESSDAEFAGNVKPNLRMVFNMEAINISQRRIDQLGDSIAEEIEAKMARGRQ